MTRQELEDLVDAGVLGYEAEVEETNEGEDISPQSAEPDCLPFYFKTVQASKERNDGKILTYYY